MRRIYNIDARKVEVLPHGVNDQLFNTRDEHIIRSNHDDELLHIAADTEEDDSILEYAYESAREGLREHYQGRTVFPVIENESTTLTLLTNISKVSTTTEWLVAVYEDKTFFFGDEPRRESQPKRKKTVEMAKIPCIDQEGTVIDLHIPIQHKKQLKDIREVVENNADVLFQVRGMRFSLARGQKMIHKLIPVSIDLDQVNYDVLGMAMPKVNDIDDVVLWRDIFTDTMVPSEIEAYIMTAAIFFYREGMAAYNLLVLGAPGCGKSFHMDLIARQCGTTNYNCTESTVKGLAFSHKDNPRPGYLYREKFIALLNEFVRIVAAQRNKAQVSEEARRMLSALNDAVERKPNRSRSSGVGEDSQAMVRCSIMTSDNDFWSVIGPLIEAMVEDSSYVRRYSILKLSEATEKKGTELASTGQGVDGSEEVEKLLRKRYLADGRWYMLMRYWRSRVDDALEFTRGSKSLSVWPSNKPGSIQWNIQDFTRAYWQEKVYERYPSADSDDAPIAVKTLLQAQFGSFALASIAAVSIMNSTFRHKESSLPGKLEFTLEDELMVLKMIQRMLDDFFKYLSVGVDKKVSQGVQRHGFSF